MYRWKMDLALFSDGFRSRTSHKYRFQRAQWCFFIRTRGIQKIVGDLLILTNEETFKLGKSPVVQHGNKVSMLLWSLKRVIMQCWTQGPCVWSVSCRAQYWEALSCFSFHWFQSELMVLRDQLHFFPQQEKTDYGSDFCSFIALNSTLQKYFQWNQYGMGYSPSTAEKWVLPFQTCEINNLKNVRCFLCLLRSAFL